MKQKFILNPFHLVEMSPWPLMGSLGALFITLGMICLFHLSEVILFILGVTIVLLTMAYWWRDVTRESTMQGYHTTTTYKGLRLGMLLFILSEVCFFFAFFWAFFHSALVPTHEIGLSWPPTSIAAFSPWSIPLLNTVVLLASGAFITWSHHAMLYQNKRCNSWSLSFTITAGIYFTYLQGMEYTEASFSTADSVYGTCFFVTTGFHGLHVLMGTTFLFMMSMRNFMLHFSSQHHLGFEAAAWYWHFVDVVWLFLFMAIYWWGF